MSSLVSLPAERPPSTDGERSIREGDTGSPERRVKEGLSERASTEVPNMSSPPLGAPTATSGDEPAWLAAMKTKSSSGDASEIGTTAPALCSVRSGRRALLPSLSRAAAREEQEKASAAAENPKQNLQQDGADGGPPPPAKSGKLAALRAENKKKRDELLRQSLDTLTLFERNQQGRLPKANLLPASEPSPIKPPEQREASGLQSPAEEASSDVWAFDSPGASSPRSPPAAGPGSPAVLEPALSVSPRLPAQSASSGNPLATPKSSGAKPFEIPSLPTGRALEIDLLSTWGDMHYVALAGIELFDASGHSIDLAAQEYTCIPDSVNVLEGYSDDPRTPDKLFDGTFFTCDDMHTWLAPFAAGRSHKISISLPEDMRGLSLLRFWNYNKSRVHAARGVRGVCVSLDGETIFKGEVARAPGSLESREAVRTDIFFHPSAEARAAITTRDTALEAAAEAEIPAAGVLPRPSIEVIPSVPPSAPAVPGPAGTQDEERAAFEDLEEPSQNPTHKEASPRVPPTGDRRSVTRQVQTLRLEIHRSWGDKHFVGLTGLEVLGEDGETLPLLADNISAHPRDLNDLPGCSGDDRTIDKIIDGVNVTMDDSHMWLAPIPNDGSPNVVTVTFSPEYPADVSGIRLWNYNKNLDDTGRGARVVKVFADGREATPPSGVVVGKAPGLVDFDFGHTVRLEPPGAGGVQPATSKGGSDRRDKPADPWVNVLSAEAYALFPAAASGPHVAELIPQDFVPGVLPCGFVLKVLIHSTWGDAHYCGLTGLAIVDAARGELPLAPSQVHADSVRSLKGNGGDARSADKLVDGVHDPDLPAHSWLAPFDPGTPQTIAIHFCEAPAVIAALRFWNYAKDPTRGAKEVEVYLDDRLVWHGFVRRFEMQQGSKASARWQQSVLFSGAGRGLMDQERPHLYVHSPGSDLTLVDEGEFRSTGAPEVGGVLHRGPAASGAHLVRPSTALRAPV